MRRNLHYWSVYNERLIWDNDYTYFLRRRYPEIVFCKAWGEEEAERLWGINVENINRIWICAYAPRGWLAGRRNEGPCLMFPHDVPEF